MDVESAPDLDKIVDLCRIAHHHTGRKREYGPEDFQEDQIVTIYTTTTGYAQPVLWVKGKVVETDVPGKITGIDATTSALIIKSIERGKITTETKYVKPGDMPFNPTIIHTSTHTSSNRKRRIRHYNIGHVDFSGEIPNSNP